MKKYLSLFIVVLMLLSVLCLSSCQYENGYVYRPNKAGDGYAVSGVPLFTTSIVSVVVGAEIPSEYRGLPVTEIASGGFSNIDNYHTVVVPSSVRVIGDYAFGRMGLLNEVEILEGTEHIGNYAFASSPQLKAVYIPSTVKSIGSSLFALCPNLLQVFYNGTVEQWNSIEKPDSWCDMAGMIMSFDIVCTDGTITVYNEILISQ